MASGPPTAPADAEPAPRRSLAQGRTRASDSTSTWPLIDRVGLVACWAAGRSWRSARSASSCSWRSRASPTCALTCSCSSPTGIARPEPGRGLPGPDRGHAAADRSSAWRSPRRSAWRSPCGCPSTRRPAWLARAVESGVDMIAGVPSIVLAIFGLILFTQSLFGLPLAISAGGAAYGRSFLIAGRDHVADRAAADRGVHARGAARRSRRTCARRATRSVRPRRPRSAACCCPSSARDRQRRALGMGRIIGDTAIVVVLLGGTLRRKEPGSGIWPLDAARHRLDADELRVQQLAGRRGQRSAEGLRRGVRAAAGRARAQLCGDRLQRGRARR